MRLRFFGCELLCGCGFLVVSYYAVAAQLRLRLFEPSLMVFKPAER